MKELKKMTVRQVAEHILDMEGRAHRLATENADLRETVDRLKTENAAMLNALVLAAPYVNQAYRKHLQEIEDDEETVYAFAAVQSFVGNIDTETLTDKNEEHGTV